MSGKKHFWFNKEKADKGLGGPAPVSSSGHEPGVKGFRLSRRRIFIITGIVVLVILGILAVPYHQNYIAPFNKTIISVDGIEVSMRYFLDRARLSGADPVAMLDTLTNELVIKIMAPQYGIQITDADIDIYLRYQASGGTGVLSDVEFEEWYRQLLNAYDVSDSQYRDIVEISLLTASLKVYLEERVPTVAEQVHLHTIVVTDYDEALAAKEKLDAGEDFATVARDVSIIGTVEEDGGDQGWVPPVTLGDYAGYVAALDINEVSGIVPYFYNQTSSSSEPDAYYIFMVSEKDSARELSEENLAIIKSMALDLWLKAEIPNHDVRYYGLYGGGFDDKTYAWINWQLAKESD